MLIAFVASVGLMMLFGCKQGDATITLTVTEVVVDMFPPNAVIELKMIDDEGANSSFYMKNIDKWFENAMLKQVIEPSGIKIIGNGQNIIHDKESKLLFEFNVNENIYRIGIGTGSKFVVRKSIDKKYTLLPEETVKLSPPPEIDEL